jgi:hypothetical protein
LARFRRRTIDDTSETDRAEIVQQFSGQHLTVRLGLNGNRKLDLWGRLSSAVIHCFIFYFAHDISPPTAVQRVDGVFVSSDANAMMRQQI